MAESKTPKEKVQAVNDLAEAIEKSKTLMIISIKSLPSKQFQEIKKSIRDYAIVGVAKKNIVLRALKQLKRESMKQLEEHIKEDVALAVSNLEGFELAAILNQKKNPVFAKAGQTAPEDIEVKAGPTDLVPGPAISELGSLGLQVAVEEGKFQLKKVRLF